MRISALGACLLLTLPCCAHDALDHPEPTPSPAAETAPPGLSSVETAKQPVVYGVDDRTDYYASENETLRRITREAIAAPMGESRLDRTDPDDIIVDTNPLGPRYGLCEDERFFHQGTAAGCSATLIDDDLLLTAGHCVDEFDCTSLRYVFNFYYRAEGEFETITEDDVYTCENVVSWALSGGYDYAIVQVDRPVVGHTPVPVTRDPTALAVDTPVWMIGFGSGLPAKLDDGGRVVGSGDADFPVRFTATVDAFGGNSGSGVFDTDGTVVGILVAGLTDYVDSDEGCSIVNVVAEDSGSGESVVYARRAVERLCANGHPSERLCPPGEGFECAPCEGNEDCADGFACPPAHPLSGVARCAPECTDDDQCRADHRCDAGACQPVWSTECRDGDSAWRSACGERGPVADVCAAVEFCGEGECQPRVAGDVCANATPIDAVSQTLDLDLGAGARDDAESADCGGDGPELVYAFTLTEERFVWAEATGSDTVLHVREGDCADGDEAVCNDDHADVAGDGSRIAVTLAAGEYFLFVDSEDDGGEVRVDLRVLRPCDALCFVGEVSCDESRTGVRSCVEGADTCPEFGDTTECGDTEVCRASTCVERVDGDECGYPLALEVESQTLTGALSEATGGETRGSCAGAGRDLVYEFVVDEPIRWRAEASGFDTVLYLREAECDDVDAEVACNDDHGDVPDRGSLLDVVLEPGEYFMFVDAYRSDTTGDFEVDIQVECGFDCELGTTRCADSEIQRCVRPPAGCPFWEPQRACGLGERCADGACAALAPGDLCRNPTRIDAVSQTLTGDLGDRYVADYRGSCAGAGPERVYSLDVRTPTDIEVVATGFDTVLYLRGTCADSESELTCNDDHDDVSSRGSLITRRLDVGTYFLFVDAYNSDVGEYEVAIAATRECDAICEIDAARCTETGREVCASGPDTCPRWSDAPCSAGFGCISGACEPESAGDNCDDPLRVDPAAGAFDFAGDADLHADTATPACGADHADRFFAFELLRRSRLDVQTVEDGVSPGDGLLSVAVLPEGCTGDALACVESGAFSFDLAPGSYVLAIDQIDAVYAYRGTFTPLCDDECALDAARCSSTTSDREVCAVTADGCHAWTPAECATGTRCDEGGCVSPPADEPPDVAPDAAPDSGVDAGADASDADADDEEIGTDADGNDADGNDADGNDADGEPDAQPDAGAEPDTPADSAADTAPGAGAESDADTAVPDVDDGDDGNDGDDGDEGDDGDDGCSGCTSARESGAPLLLGLFALLGIRTRSSDLAASRRD